MYVLLLHPLELPLFLLFDYANLSNSFRTDWGNQSLLFTGRTAAEDEAPILCHMI